MNTIDCVLDRCTDLNFIRSNVFNPGWLDYIIQRDMLETRSWPEKTSLVPITSTLYLYICDSRTQGTFNLVDRLAVHLLLETIFLGRFFNSVHPFWTKIASYHSPPVPVLMFHMTGTTAKKRKSHIRGLSNKYLVLPVMSMEREPKTITIIRHLVLQNLRDIRTSFHKNGWPDRANYPEVHSPRLCFQVDERNPRHIRRTILLYHHW